jgi:nitrogen fixation/metabolism regulation signal transduction histidine kinase
VEELKDIKGLLHVEDYSLYIFIFIVVIFLVLLYFIIKKIINYKRVVSPIKRAKKELKNLDLSDSKIASYKLTKYGKLLSNEDLEYLEKYKYKKEIVEFSKEDLQEIKGFLNAV